jgi:NADH-quinone oxidoreductase subunit N
MDTGHNLLSYFTPAVPEIFLALMAMALLVFGAFKGNRFAPLITRLAMLVVLLTALLITNIWEDRYVALGGMFITDTFAVFVKMILLLGTALVLVLSLDGMRGGLERQRAEFPVLILMAVSGMMVMVSANDLIVLYMGLELQSLSLYVLASSNRDSLRSSEAGLKYFVLGAIASGMLLYGSSLIYGFTGTTNFEHLALIFDHTGGRVSAGIILGMVMVIIGLCFKVSAVPFHMWTPDVYEGSPTIVTAFFAAVPKIAAVALLIRVLLQPLEGLLTGWQQVMVFVSAASMILGAVAALRQNNIKRLMAYSSIGHVGYIMLGVLTGTTEGVQAALIYLAIYATMSLGTFACIMRMRRQGDNVENLSDLGGLSAEQPMFAAILSIFMFSMGGIPPLAGFFGKFFIFKAALEGGHFILAIIGVLTSVIAAYYYIRVVKIMYFDAMTTPLDQEVSSAVRLVLLITVFFNLVFFLYPAPLLEMARLAALTLLS